MDAYPWEKLKELRLRLNASQEAFGQLIDEQALPGELVEGRTGQSLVSKYESGKTRPGIDRLVFIERLSTSLKAPIRVDEWLKVA